MAETRGRSTYAEIEIRREQVLRLRFARLSEPEIAERLRVSAPGFHLNKRNRLVIESKQSVTPSRATSEESAA